jgi:hypothetical protein
MNWLSSSYLPEGYTCPLEYARALRSFILSPECGTIIACHIPYIFIDDTWSRLPKEWSMAMDRHPLTWDELLHFPECMMPLSATTASPSTLQHDRWPASLRTFVATARSLHLRMFPSSSPTPTTTPPLTTTTETTAAASASSSVVNDGDSKTRPSDNKTMEATKKNHEVDKLSFLVSNVATEYAHTRNIIDVGAGKAYLSHALVINHQLNVIAIDSNAQNIVEAHRRMATMVRRRLDQLHISTNTIMTSSSSLLSSPSPTTSLIGTFHGTSARVDPLVPLSSIIDRALQSGEVYRHLTQTNHFNTAAMKKKGQAKESKGDKARDQRRAKALAKQQRITSRLQPSSNDIPITSSSNSDVPARTTGVVAKKGQRMHPGDQGAIPFTDPTNDIPIIVDSKTLTMHQSNWLNDTSRWLLTGLHCCGDLGSAMLRQYIHESHACAIVMVSCCYNLLSEHDPNQWANHHAKRFRPSHPPCMVDTKSSLSSSSSSSISSQSPAGFPMSEFFASMRLGYRARKSASRPLTTLAARGAEHILWKRHQWRALVEVVWRNATPTTSTSSASMTPISSTPSIPSIPSIPLNVGDGGDDDENILEVGSLPESFWQNGPTFESYANACLSSRLGDEHASLSHHHLSGIYERYSSLMHRVSMMASLQSILSPLIESLVLIDRLLYLQNQSCVTHVTMMPAFDPLLSPRNMVIVALKR